MGVSSNPSTPIVPGYLGKIGGHRRIPDRDSNHTDDLASIPCFRYILTLFETKRAIVSLFSRFLIRPARVDAAFGLLVDSLFWLGCWEWNEV
jgi:hypothetical protein